MKLDARVMALPAEGLTKKFVICSILDGELWYYGETDTLEEAKKICKDKLVNKCFFKVIYGEKE